jgi:anti-sigma factor RsiW
MSDYGTGARRGRHEEFERLLPWYVNGTLPDGERERVDQHLRECAGCRAEVEHDRGLAAAMRAAGEIAPAPHPAQLLRLLDRLERPAPAPARPRRRLPRLPALLASTPAPVRWVLAAQLVLAVGLFAARDWRPEPAAGPQAPATFQTLSDPVPAAAPAAAVRLRVLFTDDTPERELRRLVQEVGGHLVDGPTPLGVYTIEVPTGPASEPPEVVLEHLRSHPRVSFATFAAGSEVP